MATTFEVQELVQKDKKLDNDNISLTREDRDYLLTLRAKKVDRTKLSVAKNCR